ncbi:MAG: ATPase, T2SS/T4P/T4SS family [Candidatus Thalassarchaeaceae archaeon]|jgi:ATPase|nr:ATPase, T2SS/T4P/T4SS family [Candidatus Thalassarchaeaceae archaeon]
MATFGDHPPLPDSLESLLADETVSTLFLKAECPPRVKAGHITELRLEELESPAWDKPTLEAVADDLVTIIDQHAHRSDCFVEIEREGCRIIQAGDLRITCAWPPFSEAWEITVVRPVAHLNLADYELDPRLIKRLSDHHRGVFVVGKPGSGKTTFAQAIAAYLDEDIGAMVKTMESPRDLQVPQRVTQYAPLEGNLEKTAEVIFLVRPDFVIFDEVRRARDFEIFADVRLAGVGLLGVTHANSALEAVQRLIGKVELGMISQVLDTVIHIEKGQIAQVLELKMVVKAPSSMESDLSRPVIEVRSFPSNQMTHEIFSFGSECVVVPVDGSGSQSPAKKLASAELARQIQRWTGARVHHVEMASDTAATIFVDDGAIGAVVGQGGSGVRGMEEEFGLKLKVKGSGEIPRGTKKIGSSAPEWDMQSERSKGSQSWERSGGPKPRRKGKRRR